MQKQRPGSVTTAGVMAIVYGSLGLLCGVCGLAGLAAQGEAGGPNFMGNADPAQAEVQKQIQGALEKDLAGYQIIQVGSALLTLIVALLLLVGGIGVLNMRRWARTLTLVGCLLGCAYILIQIPFQLVVVLPATNQAMENIVAQGLPQAAANKGGPPPEEMLKFMRAFVNVGFVLVAVLYVLVIIYLLIIVWLLCRRHVRAAFAGQGLAGDDERGPREQHRFGDDTDDQGWRPPPRDDPKDGWGIRGDKNN